MWRGGRVESLLHFYTLSVSAFQYLETELLSRLLSLGLNPDLSLFFGITEFKARIQTLLKHLTFRRGKYSH